MVKLDFKCAEGGFGEGHFHSKYARLFHDTAKFLGCAETSWKARKFLEIQKILKISGKIWNFWKIFQISGKFQKSSKNFKNPLKKRESLKQWGGN